MPGLINHRTADGVPHARHRSGRAPRARPAGRPGPGSRRTGRPGSTRSAGR
ncbi:hypothetical protein ACFFX0_01975 [Citricoccus parietis]|uniref:Uncharacterized protein n=1 Tax=Citricoccus parietis TaxID=592307 RepID=A0ABV5FTK9_9MICC